MADNWYVILELEFDPPVEDEQKISDQIDAKAKFWSQNANDFKMGAQYRAWQGRLSQIRKDMIGEQNIRKQLAADACAVVYGPVDNLLKTIGRKGYITDDEIDRLSKKQKISSDVVKRRAAALGIKCDNSVGKQDYQATFDKYYGTKPQGASVYENLGALLTTFRAETLYEFLDPTSPDTHNLPCSELCAMAAKLKKERFYKNDADSGSGSKLCTQCALTFKDDKSKEEYDKYIEYARRKKILDDAKSVADISEALSAEQFDDYVAQLTRLFKDDKLAEKVMTAFCKVRNISFAARASDSKPKNIKICRCGCMNDVSDGRKVCASCGLELVIKCPKCGAENDANVRVCKCGFKFDNIDKATALCNQAEKAIDALDFAVAKAQLSDAERFWPNSPKVAALNKRLAEYEQRVGKEVAKMRAAIDDKRYFEARSQYSAIKKLFSGYSDEAVETEINNAIAKAQALYNQAKAAKAEKDILELCAQAYDTCADIPGVKELMPPPPPTEGFNVTVNPGTKTNIVSWNAANDRSVKYVVVRSTSGWIQHIADGEVVFRGSGSSFADKNIKPAEKYFYNVFAERAGIYSAGAKGNFKEAVNLFEIENVSISSADGSLNISWGKLPQGATAEISTIAPDGRETHISSSAGSNFLVSGLANGSTYRFHVALSYMVGGTKAMTAGVAVAGVPDKPPAPIDTLRVKPGKDDIFDAVWSQEGGDDVRLYYSTKRPQYLPGDIMSLSVIEQEMNPLQQLPLSSDTHSTLKAGERGASFRHSGTEVLYITAIIVKDGSAVFGTIARASKGATVTVKAIRVINGQINILLDAPKAATGFVVLHRPDRFPTDIGDVQTVRKYIPLKQYALNSAIVLDSPEPRRYYFSVFAEFTYDGEKDYSAGSDFLFDNAPKENITYSIAVNKKMFGESFIQLEFTAGGGDFELPDIDIMSMVGNTPMFKSSATLFYSIPAQHARGTLAVKIPMPKGLARDTYIKAFFRDEAAQNGSQLMIKLGSNYKIS